MANSALESVQTLMKNYVLYLVVVQGMLEPTMLKKD